MERSSSVLTPANSKNLPGPTNIDMIKAMLDGAYPHPDVPIEGRVSMEQTEEEFAGFGPMVCR